MRGDPEQEFQRAIQSRAPALRFVEQDLTDDPEDMFAAFSRRDKLFNLIRKEDQANLIVVANRGEGQDRGDLGSQFSLGLFNRAKKTGAADIHEQHQRQFAFLYEFLNEWMIHPGGNIPVDGADFVPGLIFPNLIEVHPLAFEDAMVLAGESLADEPVRPNLDLPDLFEDFSRDHIRNGNAPCVKEQGG